MIFVVRRGGPEETFAILPDGGNTLKGLSERCAQTHEAYATVTSVAALLRTRASSRWVRARRFSPDRAAAHPRPRRGVNRGDGPGAVRLVGGLDDRGTWI
jgi:hypothetical protein